MGRNIGNGVVGRARLLGNRVMPRPLGYPPTLPVKLQDSPAQPLATSLRWATPFSTPEKRNSEPSHRGRVGTRRRLVSTSRMCKEASAIIRLPAIVKIFFPDLLGTGVALSPSGEKTNRAESS